MAIICVIFDEEKTKKKKKSQNASYLVTFKMAINHSYHKNIQFYPFNVLSEFHFFVLSSESQLFTKSVEHTLHKTTKEKKRMV